ncbi:MAG: MBL fold metallo-hydrolase [Ornithinimicrobium sp.]|uniref:MBL fold metallo-hydrolase n=1 Tax=Ornithinimicrobium sp. TaxID=1977084 RepID=UPI003D9ACCD0
MTSDLEPTLTFLNGTTTVGGVQALARVGSSALCFDFGATPNPAGSLFSWPCPPPEDGSLAAHLRAGMAPLVEGLYDPAQLEDFGGGVRAACEPMRHEARLLDGMPLVDDLEHVGVFVSHVHNDHCGLLPFAGPHIPVAMSSDGAALHAGLVDTGHLPGTPARVRGLRDGEHLVIGDLDLELVPVDHDVPGAAGFVLAAGDRRIAWTGDWRAHGHAPERMTAFAERAAEVDVLVTEGTTLRPDASPVRPLSETELTERVDRLLTGTNGLAFVTPYPRNLQRLAALRDVAAANGRTLVLRPQTLALWRSAARHGLSGPGPNGEGKPLAVLAVGDAPSKSGETQVGIEDLRSDRNGFLVELQVPDRWVALAVGAGPGDLLVHCNGEPLGPRAAEWTSLAAWVQAPGLDFVWLDSGGHATPDDLAWFVEAVRPRAVVAVHSAYPQLFPRTGSPLVLPRRGQSFPVSRPAPLGLGARGSDAARTVVPCA